MVALVTQPDALLGWMDCLADPTRLRLLRLLERHELGVVELCDILQLPQSTVSRHLKVLADHGWASSRRHGTAHIYRTLLGELGQAARRLWLLAREQSEPWATAKQDDLRLNRRLRDRQTESQTFFAGAAGNWDKLRDNLYGRDFAATALLALLPAEWVVADLGCGTGRAIAQLAGAVRQVIGVDNSSPMLRAARKRAEEYNNVELRRGDLEAVPIDDGTCDAAILLLALTYVAEPAAVLREGARILKPGGILAVADLMPHDREDFRRETGQLHKGFGLPDMEKMLAGAGLEAPRCRPLAPEPGAKGPSLFLATARRSPAVVK